MTAVEARIDPFPHSVAAGFLGADAAERMLAWLEQDAPWKLRVEDFYEQHECSLSTHDLPDHLKCILSSEAVSDYARHMLAPLGAEKVELVEATAHRLTAGQTIRIHNDYIDGEETHRLIVQLNRSWQDENGGFLMLFSSPDARDVARVLRPVHRSAIAFEISPDSFHAVSPTVRGERYTLVFSYREQL
ncbi:MAG TPA: cyclophane-containing peptide 2OG-Fe(II) oxygenase YhhC [Allosphingosinicella sp.]|jgi:Rps23 Pro-64 3,4-dihydroxylase Tpa1-like proline 4-hydroxylase|nr:cyclophane-containing peptide 2OG-Fe(II) oxygenase YhhC [Allosphingosinicella sp.]